jgi:putative inorganic carbon (hco3(-)) transporter
MTLGFIKRLDRHAVLLVLPTLVGVLIACDVYWLPEWYDQQRITLLVALLLVASITAMASDPVRQVDWHISLAYLLAVVCGVISVVLASQVVPAIAEWSLISLVFAIAALGIGRSDRDLIGRLASLTFILVAGLYVLGVAIKYLITVASGVNPGAEVFLLYLSNPRFPAHLQAMTLPLAPIAISRATTAPRKVFVFAIAILWWMCLFGSASRTAWIATAAATLFIVFLGQRGRPWLRLHMFGAFGGAAALTVLFHFLPQVLGLRHELETGRFESFSSFAARLQMHELALGWARESPWFGIGPMHFAAVNNGIAASAHNFWIQHLAEWGVLSLACIVVAIGRMLWRLSAQVLAESSEVRDDAGRLTTVGVLAAIVAWIVGNLGDGYMVVPTSQAVSAVVLALGVALLPPVPSSKRVAQVATLGWRMVVFLSAVGLCVVAASPLGDPVTRHQKWLAEQAEPILLVPRFWQQGWIGPDADPTAR